MKRDIIDSMAEKYLDATKWQWILDELDEFWKHERKTDKTKPQYNERGGAVGIAIAFVFHIFCDEFLFRLPDAYDIIAYVVTIVGFSIIGGFYQYIPYLSGFVLGSVGYIKSHKKLKKKFLSDTLFRVQEMHRYLTSYKIERLQSEVDAISAQISTAARTYQAELNRDLAEANRLIDSGCFTNEVQCERMKEARNNIATQLRDVNVGKPAKLLSELNSANNELKVSNDIAIELKRLVDITRTSSTADPLIDKYASTGYKSVNEEILDQKFEEQVNRLQASRTEISRVNMVGADIVNETRELNSGLTPVDRLIESNDRVN